MRCGKVKKLLPLYVGGELSAGHTNDIERHIAECAACRAEAISYEKACRALSGIANEPIPQVSPEEYWIGVRTRLQSVEVRCESPARRRGWLAENMIFAPGPMMMAAVFLVSLCLGLFIGMVLLKAPDEDAVGEGRQPLNIRSGEVASPIPPETRPGGVEPLMELHAINASDIEWLMDILKRIHRGETNLQPDEVEKASDPRFTTVDF